MNLNEKLVDILGEISEHVGWLDPYARRKHAVLDYVHRKDLIDDSDIDVAIEAGIVKEAKGYYKKLLVYRREYPDHVPFPQFLAYAISNKVFSSKEISRIQFDHGEDAAEFCRIYSVPNLIGKLRKELLNPKPLPKYDLSSRSLSPGDFCESCPPCFEH